MMNLIFFRGIAYAIDGLLTTAVLAAVHFSGILPTAISYSDAAHLIALLAFLLVTLPLKLISGSTVGERICKLSVSGPSRALAIRYSVLGLFGALPGVYHDPKVGAVLGSLWFGICAAYLLALVFGRPFPVLFHDLVSGCKASRRSDPGTQVGLATNMKYLIWGASAFVALFSFVFQGGPQIVSQPTVKQGALNDEIMRNLSIVSVPIERLNIEMLTRKNTNTVGTETTTSVEKIIEIRAKTHGAVPDNDVDLAKEGEKISAMLNAAIERMNNPQMKPEQWDKVTFLYDGSTSYGTFLNLSKNFKKSVTLPKAAAVQQGT